MKEPNVTQGQHNQSERAAAESLALAALTYIAGQGELLDAFLMQSGAEPESLRDVASDPGFFGFVLEFILQDDARVLGLAAEQGVAPERIAAARQALPGGEEVNWT